MDKHINTIIEINIEHNYSKYHIKKQPENRQIITRLSQDYHKILTTKKHKNRQKQHSTIIAIDIQKIQLQKSYSKKIHIQNDIQLQIQLQGATYRCFT